MCDIRVQLRIVAGRIKSAEGEISQALLQHRKLLHTTAGNIEAPLVYGKVVELQETLDEMLTIAAMAHQQLADLEAHHPVSTVNGQTVEADGTVKPPPIPPMP